ncbi:MAG: response regulator transcription factor [Acidimicrobiales bacterium]
MAQLRLAVHDDRPLVRDGLTLLLSDEPDLIVVVPDDEGPPPDVAVIGANATPEDTVVASTRVVQFTDAMSIEMIVAAVRDSADTNRRSRVRPTSERTCRTAMALTPREFEVLTCIAAGLSATEVSEQLGLARKTVENHKRRIFVKLDVQNQGHAVAVATRAGLLVDGL